MAEPAASAAASEASGHEVASAAEVGLFAPVVVSAAAPEAAAEAQAFVDIAPVFAVLVPVPAVAVEADTPGRPTLFASPNIDSHASSSSSAEAVR